MKYRRFEELPVWQAAIELAAQVYQMTSDASLRRQRSLRDQIERAAVSVSNNIAEGFERGTNAELLTFLFIARGSASEVRSMIHLLRRLSLLQERESVLSNLESLSENIARQLGGWIESLKDSGFRGSRYENTATRDTRSQTLRREAYLEKLKEIQKGGRAETDPGES
jgi:four helix bundle protein